MKTKSTLLVIALSGILTACGSGSSQGTTAKTDITTTSVGAGIQVRNTKNGKATTPYIQATGSFSGDKNKLIIDGKTIELVPDSVASSDEFYGIGSATPTQVFTDKIVSRNKYQYSRFGFVRLNNGFTTFSQGNITTTMPTADESLIYKGDAVAAVTAKGATSPNYVTTGTASLTVNFAKKDVIGVLQNWKKETQNIGFKAKINGVQFESKNVMGQFYGPNATELGGVVNNFMQKDGSAVSAAFGAKKQ